jgi:hypothetical protein
MFESTELVKAAIDGDKELAAELAKEHPEWLETKDEVSSRAAGV